MKQIRYVGFLFACFVLMSGATASAEFSPSVSTAKGDLSCEEKSSILVAQAGDTQGEKPSGGIEERAVPRMGPGSQGTPVPQVEGGRLEGNRLLANPGYVIQPQTDGTVMLRPAGGGTGGSFSCSCSGRGGCAMVAQGGEAYCVKSDSNPCKNTCTMVIKNVSGGMMMQ